MRDIYAMCCLRPPTKDVFEWTGHAVRGDSSVNGSGLRRDRRLVQLHVGDLRDLRAATLAIEGAHLRGVLLQEQLWVHPEIAIVDEGLIGRMMSITSMVEQREEGVYLDAIARAVLLLDERLVDVERLVQLLIRGIIDEDALSVRLGNGEALLAVARLPTGKEGRIRYEDDRTRHKLTYRIASVALTIISCVKSSWSIDRPTEWERL